MVFNSFHKYLHNMEETENLSAEQILGSFQEICKDVTESGKGMVYHEVQDLSSFMELLFWLGNLYCRLVKEKGDMMEAAEDAEDIRELCREIEGTQKTLKEMQDRIRGREQEQEQLLLTIGETKERETKISEEISRLKEQRELLRVKLEEQAGKKEEEEKKMVLLREEFEKLKEEASLVSDDVESMRRNNEKFRDHQLAKAQSEYLSVKQQEEKMKQDFQELITYRDELLAQIEKLKVRKEETEGEIHSAEYGKEQVEKRLVRLQEKHKKITEEKQEQEQREAQLSETHQILLNQKMEVENKNLLTEEEIDNIQDEIEQTKERNKSLLEILEKSRGDRSKLNEETENFQKEIEFLQKELDDLDRERENLHVEQEELKKRMEELNKLYNPTVLKEAEQRLKKEKDKAACIVRQLKGIKDVAGVLESQIGKTGDFQDIDRIRMDLAEIEQRIEELGKQVKSYEKIIEENLT